MNKKILIAVLALVLLAGVAVVIKLGTFGTKHDAGVGKVYRVGIFSGLAYFDEVIVGFKQKMTELGYVEGENIIYDVQRGPTPVGNQELLRRFVVDGVDLILVYPTEATLEAKEVTAGTNIAVISVGAYMEGGGLIENITYPGGNLTGVRFPIQEVAVKRLEVLHELAPNAKRILVPHLKDYPTVAPSLEVIRPMTQSLGLTLIEAPFSNPSEVDAFLKGLPPRGEKAIDAILFIAEPISIIPAFRDPIYAFAEAQNIPLAGVGLSPTGTGPLFSVFPDGAEFGTLAAPLADKIFKGIPAGSIPIATAESAFEINYLVAEKLGLPVSDSLLSMARKIVH